MSLHIERLKVRNFRNYVDYEIVLHRELTVIHGPNAIGKTNLIEALQLVTAGESFRKPRWNDVIKTGEVAARIELVATGDNRLLEVILDIEADKGRQYSVNRSPRRSISGSTGSIPSVLFTPEDLGLVRGSSEQRRGAIDSLGEQLSASYRSLRLEYQRILRQRNALLKDGDNSYQLDVWNQQLVDTGVRLMKHRSQLLERLAERVEKIHHHMTDGETLELTYLPSWQRDGETTRSAPIEQWEALFEETVASHKQSELRRGTTLYGPHRDEIKVTLEGKPARVFSSQGQQRSIALAWKLAEVDVVKEILQVRPLLLLDDVMSELDETRRALLMDRVQEAAQTVITTTNLPYFDESLLSEGEVVSLE